MTSYILSGASTTKRTLASADVLTVIAGAGNLAVLDDHAIQAANGNVSLYIFGNVFGSVSGFYDASAYGDSILIGQNGSLTGDYGLSIAGGDSLVTNAGTIGGRIAARFGGSFNTLVNSGDVVARATALEFDGGNNTVTNSGVISGTNKGLEFFGSSNAIFNSGQIMGGSHGVLLSSTGGGTLINNSGSISGKYGIYSREESYSVVNTGAISGDYAAIYANSNESIIYNSGVIAGDSYGVYFTGSSNTIINAGLISGSVVFGAGFNTYDGSLGSVSRYIYALSGSNDFTGGSGTDRFAMYGGSFFVNAGDGADFINAKANLTPGQHIDGGAGGDIVQLDGQYASGIVFEDDMMVNVETLRLLDGNSYTLTMNEQTVANGARLAVDASRLNSWRLIFDASAESDGYYTVLGGSGADSFTFAMEDFSRFDVIKGGAGSAIDALHFTTSGTFSATTLAGVSGVEWLYLGHGTDNLSLTDALVGSAYNRFFSVFGGLGADTIDGGAVASANRLRIYGGQGADLMTAGAGADQFGYFYVSESTGSNYDTIDGMNLSVDRFDLPGTNPITAIDAAVTTGALSTSTFNANLASALSAARLGAHHAVAFTPSSGALAGETFLVADMNGVAGYQANVDLVVRLTNETGVLAVGAFF